MNDVQRDKNRVWWKQGWWGWMWVGGKRGECKLTVKGRDVEKWRAQRLWWVILAGLRAELLKFGLILLSLCFFTYSIWFASNRVCSGVCVLEGGIHFLCHNKIIEVDVNIDCSIWGKLFIQSQTKTFLLLLDMWCFGLHLWLTSNQSWKRSTNTAWILKFSEFTLSIKHKLLFYLLVYYFNE